MSGRTAKAARRALATAYDLHTLDERADDLIARFYAAGGREATVERDPLEIRYRLGRRAWGPPLQHGMGWRFQRYDNTAMALVTAACWPELPDAPIIHASISRHNPVTIPTYEDLQLLHRAVWPDGNAMQAFVPEDDHVNIRPNVLHLWGRADGQRLWSIDFGQFGTI